MIGKFFQLFKDVREHGGSSGGFTAVGMLQSSGAHEHGHEHVHGGRHISDNHDGAHSSAHAVALEEERRLPRPRVIVPHCQRAVIATAHDRIVVSVNDSGELATYDCNTGSLLSEPVKVQGRVLDIQHVPQHDAVAVLLQRNEAVGHFSCLMPCALAWSFVLSESSGVSGVEWSEWSELCVFCE